MTKMTKELYQLSKAYLEVYNTIQTITNMSEKDAITEQVHKLNSIKNPLLKLLFLDSNPAKPFSEKQLFNYCDKVVNNCLSVINSDEKIIFSVKIDVLSKIEKDNELMYIFETSEMVPTEYEDTDLFRLDYNKKLGTMCLYICDVDHFHTTGEVSYGFDDARLLLEECIKQDQAELVYDFTDEYLEFWNKKNAKEDENVEEVIVTKRTYNSTKTAEIISYTFLTFDPIVDERTGSKYTRFHLTYTKEYTGINRILIYPIVKDINPGNEYKSEVLSEQVNHIFYNPIKTYKKCEEAYKNKSLKHEQELIS
ncbi:hypothetical protein O0Q50_22395 [Priestia aryabhattai]|uniref:Uncharacterized protein n=1 Tax=Priestia aryabhattai TaxID=412384 RepID=A0AAX6NEL5_PRIAR|nr:hypothetical protein [Priestia aryabhattai]MDU9693934.1 hypothetical protein [Priestia aryabhattai]